MCSLGRDLQTHRNRRWHRSIWLAIALLAVPVLVPASSPGQGKSSDGDVVAVDFDNVDLRLFIKFVSEVTGRIFLLDDRVRGQVSVRFTNKIPVDHIYEVLESVLELKGFAAVPTGYVTKIVPLNSAKQRGIEVSSTDSPSPTGR